MADVIKYRFRCRRRTAAEWTSVNEILLAQEIGLEEDTGLGKIGDGFTAWNDLLYTIVGQVDLTGLADGKVLTWDATAGIWTVGDGGKVYQAGTNITINNPTTATPTINSTLGVVNLKGSVDAYSDLPSSGLTAGDVYYVKVDAQFYQWDGSAWPAQGEGIPVGNTNESLRILNHFEGANGSTTFSDEVTGVWSRRGSSVISTAQAKFGLSSLSLPSAGSQIYYPASKLLDFQDQDFTVEAFIRPSSAIASQAFGGWVISTDSTQSNSVRGFTIHISKDGALGSNFYDGASSTNFGLSPNPSLPLVTWDAWQHVAVTRKGGVLRLFLEGNKLQETSFANPFLALNSAAAEVNIGSNPGGQSGTYYTGYIDEIRAIKGKCLYTANFTPPSAPFQNN